MLRSLAIGRNQERQKAVRQSVAQNSKAPELRRCLIHARDEDIPSGSQTDSWRVFEVPDAGAVRLDGPALAGLAVGRKFRDDEVEGVLAGQRAPLDRDAVLEHTRDNQVVG